jgi:hypothetical protein
MASDARRRHGTESPLDFSPDLSHRCLVHLGEVCSNDFLHLTRRPKSPYSLRHAKTLRHFGYRWRKLTSFGYHVACRVCPRAMFRAAEQAV